MDIGSKGLAEVNLTIPQETSLTFDVVHKDEDGHIVDHSASTLSERTGTTPYGVYVKAGTISTGTPRTLTLIIYQRYNSTSSGTINGSYVLDVYGVKLQDLL